MARKPKALTPESTGPETSMEPVQLTLNDMQAAANVIDLASRRGAFHAKEMTSVGEVYNKLAAFLEHVAAQQPAAPAKQEETTEA